jgi:hypothetical protein
MHITTRFTTRRSTRLTTILLTLACRSAPSAHADWMVGGFLGHARTQSSTVGLSLPAQQTDVEIVGVAYRGESFKAPQYYGYRIAWLPNARPWLGVEVELIHAKVFAEANALVQVRGSLQGAAVDAALPLSSVVQRLAMSHGLNFIFANLVLRRDLGAPGRGGTGRLVAVMRVGGGPTLPHAESSISGVEREQYEGGGFGAQGAGGLELAVWRGLGVTGEYKFTWASPRIGVAGGEATIPARTHHLVGGLAYRF